MNAAEALIKYLYQGFLLRDVFGKIVPGALVLLGVVTAVSDEAVVEVIDDFSSQHGALVALALGLAWPLGFVAQAPREFVEWLLMRIRLIADVDWVEVVAARARTPDGDERGGERRSQELERMAVIKEATGNLAFAALFLGLVFWCADSPAWRADGPAWRREHLWAVGCGLLLFVFSLVARTRELVLHRALLGEEPWKKLGWLDRRRLSPKNAEEGANP